MRLLLFFLFAFGAWCHAEVELRTPRPRPLQCDGIGRHKHLQMQNPSQLPARCVYRIQPMNMNVCQIRVHFEAIFQQPTTPSVNGTGVPRCEHDKFLIDGLELCGNLRNQHVYIPVLVTRENRRQTYDLILQISNRRLNPTLSFVSWNIHVTQLECARNTPAVVSGRMPLNPSMARSIANDVDHLAPHGCLQYHTESEGTIESFNFNGGAGPYPPNMNYAICIRKRRGNSKIEFTFNGFNMSSVKSETEGFNENCLARSLRPAPPPPEESREPTPPASGVLNEDYLMIPSATTNRDLRVNKFCGNTINKQTATANPPGPYVLQFHSDGVWTAPDDKAREGGFSINYRVQ